MYQNRNTIIRLLLYGLKSFQAEVQEREERKERQKQLDEMRKKKEEQEAAEEAARVRKD